ncbi:MAG: gliding motility-associated C-terminal domain-containing protein [Saprospirales bacterium]|nr:gliding motility-associated C-terminal domain-containing protein [Saprospirales bacterium]
MFYEIPSALIQGSADFCAGESVDLSISVTGGVAPWTVNLTNTLGQPISVTVPSSPFTWTVAPPGTTLYTITSVTDGNCIGTGSGLGSVTQQGVPFGIDVTVTPDPTNTEVVVCFTIVGGDQASYVVTGWPGTLTGTQFCSDPIPCDQGTYQFLVQDGFFCITDTLAGPIICNCASGAGVMTQVAQTVCEFDAVSSTPATGTQFDGNDVLMYVLHTGAGTSLGTIIATNSTPDFTYDAATMDCDANYYISSVVGDNDGTGSVDLGDDCLSVSQGTPVVFNCLPTATISGGGPICAGQSINGSFALSGEGPFNVVLNDGIQDITLPAIINGYVWSLTPTQTTTYSLLSIEDITTGCSNTATGSITVTVNNPVFAGTANAPTALCSGVGQLIGLGSLLTGADPGGVWTETSTAPSTGGAFNAGAGTFNTAGQAPGTYTFRYFMDATPPCVDDNETVTVIIHPLPTADAGAAQELTCGLTAVEIGGTGTSTGAQFTYEWTLVGSTNVIGSQTTLSVGQAGTYQLTVINTQTGCESSDQVDVTQNLDTPVATVSAEDVSCFGAGDGFILVETITGGKPPYMFALNGGAFGDQQQFSNLSGGDYLIAIQDANGCEVQVLVTVIEPQELTATLVVNLQPDNEGNYFLELGEELDLDLQSSFAIADLDTIIWSPADLVACNDPFCASVTVAPQEGTIFTVTVEKGPCEASDQFRLLIRKPRPVFIPNIFSPNDDGQNDVFFIQAGKQVQEIRSFLVFNRWGESVFEAYDFQPNDITIGWDGYHRGKRVDPGVFAYYVEVLYIDGYVELLKGDVSLIR